MIKTKPNIFYVLVVFSLVLSACGGASIGVNTGGGKPLASEYIGIIDDMDDDQWVINGVSIVIDLSDVRGGPFSVGDMVKVEGVVNDDGSFTVTQVGMLEDDDDASLPEFGTFNNDGTVGNSNTNSNDNTGNSNDDDDDDDENSNDSAGNSNDDDDDEEGSNNNSNDSSNNNSNNNSNDTSNNNSNDSSNSNSNDNTNEGSNENDDD